MKIANSINIDESTSFFRIRFLEIGSLFTGITTCVAVCLRYFVQAFPINLFILNLFLGIVVLVNGLVAKRFKTTLIPSIIYIGSLLFIGINAGTMYGGIYAPAVVTITLCPLFASLLGGRLFSRLSLIISLSTLAGMYLAGTQGLIVVKDTGMELGRLVVYIALTLGLYFTGHSLEKARQSTEIELQKKEIQIRSILETSPIGMIVTNKNLDILVKNQRAIEMFPELASLSSIENALPNSLISAIKEKSSTLNDSEKNINDVIDLKNTGPLSRIRFKILDFSFDAAKEKNILINMIDETDSVRAEEMQRALMTQSKMAALGEMASGIAHEINNPLAIIFGKCAVIVKNIKNKNFDSERVVAEIDKILATSGRIAKIVTGLLSFAREGGTDDFSEVTVSSLIDNTLSICTERFKLSGVELTCELNGHNEVNIYCHPSQISQVLVNLLNNAFDELTTKDANKVIPIEKWVQIHVKADETHVEINVIDAGLGISEAVKEKIFNPFYTTKPVGSGTGLGLSISKGLIENHGGTLSCGLDPVHQRNTCFAVKIPQKKSA